MYIVSPGARGGGLLMAIVCAGQRDALPVETASQKDVVQLS